MFILFTLGRSLLISVFVVILVLKNALVKHRHAKRARVIFCDRSIRRTVYSNDLVKFFWLRCTARKKLGTYDVHTMLHQ